MEIWIRSQDKMKLFRGIDFRGVVEQEGCSIIDNTDDYIIGTYKSIERALEILDEIQKLLMPKCIINPKTMKFSEPYEGNGMVLMDCSADARLEQLSTYVYEMPEE